MLSSMAPKFKSFHLKIHVNSKLGLCSTCYVLRRPSWTCPSKSLSYKITVRRYPRSTSNVSEAFASNSCSTAPSCKHSDHGTSVAWHFPRLTCSHVPWAAMMSVTSAISAFFTVLCRCCDYASVKKALAVAQWCAAKFRHPHPMK